MTIASLVTLVRTRFCVVLCFIGPNERAKRSQTATVSSERGELKANLSEVTCFTPLHYHFSGHDYSCSQLVSYCTPVWRACAVRRSIHKRPTGSVGVYFVRGKKMQLTSHNRASSEKEKVQCYIQCDTNCIWVWTLLKGLWQNCRHHIQDLVGKNCKDNTY